MMHLCIHTSHVGPVYCVNIGRRGKISYMYIHIRARQRNWMGHLQREIMEGRMEGKRGRGRPRQKLLDWMMSEGYGKLKEEAQNREKWSHRTSGPARGQIT